MKTKPLPITLDYLPNGDMNPRWMTEDILRRLREEGAEGSDVYVMFEGVLEDLIEEGYPDPRRNRADRRAAKQPRSS